MKKSSFVLGLIAGIIGIILCILLTVIWFNMKVNNPNGTSVIIFSNVGLLASIAGLVGACVSNSKGIIAGILMIIAAILNFMTAFVSIGADSPLNFVGGLLVTILFLLAGIFAFVGNKSTKKA